MKPVLHVGNLVTRGTLSGTARPEAPLSRLADGDILLPWIDSNSGNVRYVTLDLGAGVTGTASTCVLGPNHNLLGIPISLETAADPGGPWTAGGATYTPLSAAAFRVPLTVPRTARCWRVVAGVAPTAPQATEWILSDALTLPSGPQEPALVTGWLGNVQTYESPAGYVWARKRGAPRWEADYQIRDLTHEERADLEAAFLATDEGARAFPLEDADGILRWVHWLPEGGKLPFQAEGRTRWRVLLRFRQAL